MQRLAERLRVEKRRIGFVPTMGALHEGHLSLVRAARRECEVVVVSIFVNPTQFAPGEDYERYPRPLGSDIAACRREGVDYVFHPRVSDMYPQGAETTVVQGFLPNRLCGLSRPGHFSGVMTVVAKLFNIVKPHLAYFGQKDYQQAQIIKRMVADLNMDVRIKVLPIVREADGLAMSSRNRYLSPEQRKNALCLYQALCLARDMVQAGERSAARIISRMRRLINAHPETKIDYIAMVTPDTLERVKQITGPVVAALAVHVGPARLIDNMILKPSKVRGREQ
jgi:pantoate--beta-alanine ligase